MTSLYGYSGHEDVNGYVAGLGEYVAMGALAYTPDLQPVGSGPAYYPRDTSADARALNYLGFYPEPAFSAHVGTMGTQAADMSSGTGAWDPEFQAAVTAFQSSRGITVDGWVGPQTRGALAVAVQQLNNAAPNPNPLPPAPIPPPIPIPPNVLPPAPIPPGPMPVPQPVVQKTTDNTMLYAGVGAAALALLGVGYWALSD